MLQTIFNISTTIMILFLAVIWTRSGIFNMLIKFLLVLLTIYGIFICFKDFGFVVKIS